MENGLYYVVYFVIIYLQGSYIQFKLRSEDRSEDLKIKYFIKFLRSLFNSIRELYWYM